MEAGNQMHIDIVNRIMYALSKLHYPTCPRVLHMHFVGTMLLPPQRALLKTHIPRKLMATTFWPSSDTPKVA